MNALIDIEHLGVILAAIASALVILAAVRKLQLAIRAAPRFARFRLAVMGVVKVFQNPDGSRTERLINAVKVEILNANTVSDDMLKGQIADVKTGLGVLQQGHDELKEQTRAMGEANDAQHAQVAGRIDALTGEVSEVKDRLTAVERKLP